MVDFSVFDSMLDAVFAVDATAKVVYCNEIAATLCQTSLRRVVGKAALHDLISFDEVTLPLSETSPGWSSPSGYVETVFKLLKAEKTGKVQVAVHPVVSPEGSFWVFFL